MTYSPPAGRPVSSPPCADTQPDGKPVRMKGENKNAYATRVYAWMHRNDPAFAARHKKATISGNARKVRKARKVASSLCATLNQTEKRGLWMTRREVMAALNTENENTFQSFTKKHRLDIRRAYAREHIFLMPIDVLPTPPTITPPVVAKTTIWQRLFSWVNW